MLAIAANPQLVTLRLEGGLGMIPSQAALSNGVPQPVRRDMELEFTMREGRWGDYVAGFAVFYNPRFAGKELHSYNRRITSASRTRPPRSP
jgi:hypothetical protein